MKIKKRILSLALAGTMALGLMPGMTMTALADGDTSYTLTIPSTLSVANSGWNATDGISATGALASGKKLTVTASSDGEFALVNQSDNTQKVGYKLATTSADTEATTSWTFDSLSSTATKKDMGIIVEDYSTKPAGTYTDTVTFTAKVEDPIPVTAITLNKTETLLGVGSTETLSVSSVTPDNATDQTVTWSSDNTSVATVDASTGVVTGVAKGTANITATANDGSGVSATCAVKVSTLAAAFVDGAVIKVSFKWRGSNAGDYVQGTYSASSGTFTVSKGGSNWGTESRRAVYKVEKSGNNITVGAGLYDYDVEGMLWTFNAASDTYTYTPGDIVKDMPTEFGLISVTLNGTDITSQLTMQ